MVSPAAALNGKRVAVLGVGVEGSATIRWLLAHGVTPAVCDRSDRKTLGATYDELTKLGVTDWRLGTDYLKKLKDFHVIFRTPLLPFARPELQAARQAGVTVTSQTKFFFEHCPSRIVGVSGTKGKGTTAGLIHRMLEAAGKTAYLGGNIGTPPLEFLDKLQASDIVVLELSSFQLEDLEHSPHIAVLTNLTVDHLDRHQTIEEYHQAKTSLVRHQVAADLAILNAEDEGSKAMAELAGGRIHWFSHRREVTPGTYVEEDSVRLKLDEKAETVCAVSDIVVPGRHNLENVLAATLAAAELGVPVAVMSQVIKDYRGLPYHLEFIGEHGGVRYFNDSYATNPTATIPAIESFDSPLVLILGGAAKQLDYTELADVIVQRPEQAVVKALVVIPPEGERIAAAVSEAAKRAGKLAPSVITVTNKAEIVPKAADLAASDDVVLLSPATASFGMFNDYVERGRFFTEAVNALN